MAQWLGEPEEEQEQGPGGAESMRAAGAAGLMDVPAAEPGPAVAPEERGPVPAPLSSLESSDDVKMIPVSAIYTDPKRFQFRDIKDANRAYSEARVDQIIADFDPVRFETIKVVESPPKSGTYVVIAGHHRLAVAQKMDMDKMKAEVLGPEVGNPETKAGQDKLKAAAMSSNYGVRAESLTGDIGSFRQARTFEHHKLKKPERFIEIEQGSLPAERKKLILAMADLPDEIITFVSDHEEGGNPKFNAYARELGLAGQRYGNSADELRNIWARLKVLADSKRGLPSIEDWKFLTKQVLSTNVERQIGGLLDSLDLTKQDTAWEETLAKLSDVRRSIPAAARLIEQCADGPEQDWGMDMSAIRPILEAKLQYAIAMREYLEKKAVDDYAHRESGPEPEMPEILKNPAMAKERAVVDDRVGQEVKRLEEALAEVEAELERERNRPAATVGPVDDRELRRVYEQLNAATQDAGYKDSRIDWLEKNVAEMERRADVANERYRSAARQVAALVKELDSRERESVGTGPELERSEDTGSSSSAAAVEGLERDTDKPAPVTPPGGKKGQVDFLGMVEGKRSPPRYGAVKNPVKVGPSGKQGRLKGLNGLGRSSGSAVGKARQGVKKWNPGGKRRK